MSHTHGSKGPMPYGYRSPSPGEACAPEVDRKVFGIYNLEIDLSVPIGLRHRVECLRPRHMSREEDIVRLAKKQLLSLSPRYPLSHGESPPGLTLESKHGSTHALAAVAHLDSG
jgi:hypothetical protein